MPPGVVYEKENSQIKIPGQIPCLYMRGFIQFVPLCSPSYCFQTYKCGLGLLRFMLGLCFIIYIINRV